MESLIIAYDKNMHWIYPDLNSVLSKKFHFLWNGPRYVNVFYVIFFFADLDATDVTDVSSIVVVCSHCIIIPQGSTGSKTFWCQMKVYIFLIATQNF